MSKPTIVVVPGAWQKPVAFNEFLQKLQAAGYQTEIVPLTTVGGTTTPLTGLEDDVAAVQATLKKLADAGSKALVVAHSAGGLVASNAVSGFDNIAGVIYMSAFMIPAGKAILDMLGGNPLPWMSIEGDRVTGVAEMLPHVAFNDMDPAAQETWAKEMSHTSIRLFATPSQYEPWKHGVPCGYIFCAEDNALPLPIQQGMATQLGHDAATVSVKAGHCPHLSMPDELVEAVRTLETRVK